MYLHNSFSWETAQFFFFFFFTPLNSAKTRMENSVTRTGILRHQMPFSWVQGLPPSWECSLMSVNCWNVPRPWNRNRCFPSWSTYKQQSRLSLLQTAEGQNTHLQSLGGAVSQSQQRISEAIFLWSKFKMWMAKDKHFFLVLIKVAQPQKYQHFWAK